MAVYRVRLIYVSPGVSNSLGRDHLHTLTIVRYLTPHQILDIPDSVYYCILYSDFD